MGALGGTWPRIGWWKSPEKIDRRIVVYFKIIHVVNQKQMRWGWVGEKIFPEEGAVGIRVQNKE